MQRVGLASCLSTPGAVPCRPVSPPPPAVQMSDCCQSEAEWLHCLQNSSILSLYDSLFNTTNPQASSLTMCNFPMPTLKHFYFEDGDLSICSLWMKNTRPHQPLQYPKPCSQKSAEAGRCRCVTNVSTKRLIHGPHTFQCLLNSPL